MMANKDEEVTTFAYDINPKHRNTVLNMQIATFVCDNIHDAISEADLIILSIPVGSMKTVASVISSSLKDGVLLLILGPQKVLL